MELAEFSQCLVVLTTYSGLLSKIVFIKSGGTGRVKSSSRVFTSSCHRCVLNFWNPLPNAITYWWWSLRPPVLKGYQYAACLIQRLLVVFTISWWGILVEYLPEQSLKSLNILFLYLYHKTWVILPDRNSCHESYLDLRSPILVLFVNHIEDCC